MRKGAFCFDSPYFRFYYKKSLIDSDNGRLGLVVSRKVGKAHDRNYLKRSLREDFRKSTLKTCGQDILVIVSPRISKLNKKIKRDEVSKTIDEFIKNIKIHI